MFDLITSIVLNFISDVIYQYNKKLKEGKSSKGYLERASIFNKQIAPFVIEKILKLRNNEIYLKLAEVDVASKKIKLPYLDIGNEKTKITSLANKNLSENHDDKLLIWLKKDLGKTLFNNKTFTLNCITANNEAIIGVGDYFSTISTSDIHYHNLVQNYPIQSKKLTTYFYRYKKQTSNWLEQLSSVSSKCNFDNYTASIGCSVLTVFKASDSKYKFFIKQNSAKKAAGGGDRHVVPSFMFGPVSKNIKEQYREIDICTHIVKEYGEELLGLKECDTYENYDTLLGLIKGNIYLQDLYSRNNVDLIQTGLVLDIFRMRPEFTFVLIIHDVKYSENIKPNWETEARTLDVIDINDSTTINNLFDYEKSGLCAPGLAAVNKGLPVALKAIAAHKKRLQLASIAK